jgi:hypothetical protein
MPADPGFTALQDRVRAATAQPGEPGLPVGCLLEAAAWLESFSRGESGYGGLGQPGARWLAQAALAILDAAGDLAAALRPWPPPAGSTAAYPRARGP